MGELSIPEQDRVFSLLENMQTADEIKEVVKKLDDIKQLLIIMDEFRDKSIQFAKLEATTLIKIATIGGISAITGHRRRVAEWLLELSEDEQNIYIGMCSDGLSIVEIWRREIKPKEDLANNILNIKEDEKDIINTLTEEGIVDVTQHFEDTRFKLADKSLANDLNNGLRSRIRQAGGIGVGSDTGIYVMPNSTNVDLVKKAIIQRFESVINDIANIVEIASKSNVQLTHEELLSGHSVFLMTKSASAKEKAILHTTLGICESGIISNENEVYKLCAKEEIRRELDFVRKHINMSKKEELEYLSKQVEVG